MWMRQVFEGLLTYSVIEFNLKVDDICWVFYDSLVGKGTYRLAKVASLYSIIAFGRSQSPLGNKSLPYDYNAYKRSHLAESVQHYCHKSDQIGSRNMSFLLWSWE